MRKKVEFTGFWKHKQLQKKNKFMKKTVIDNFADRLFLSSGIIDALSTLSSATLPYQQPFCNIWVCRLDVLRERTVSRGC